MARIVIVGGAGDMARVAAEKLLEILDDVHVVLADLNEEKAGRVARSLRSAKVESAGVDLFDPPGLQRLIHKSDLVANCAGPYFRTARPVAEACIREKVNYIDLGDDEESATELLALDGAAREAGVTILICCGVAPGLVNVIFRGCAMQMEEVENVDIAWVTGSTPPREGEKKGGEAVLEHMLHACLGNCLTFRDGRHVQIPSFRHGEVLPFPEPLGPYRVFELGHSEVATIPHFFPGVRNVRSLGALHPPYLNGLFRGIAGQVERDAVDIREAARFILALDTKQKPETARPYLGLLKGVFSQVGKGHLSPGGLLGLFREIAGKSSQSCLGGLLVRVDGVMGGKRVRMQSSYADHQGKGDKGMDMDESTGTPMAVMASMLFEGLIPHRGVLAPEACVDPEAFQVRMARLVPDMEDPMKVEILSL